MIAEQEHFFILLAHGTTVAEKSPLFNSVRLSTNLFWLCRVNILCPLDSLSLDGEGLPLSEAVLGNSSSTLVRQARSRRECDFAEVVHK